LEQLEDRCTPSGVAFASPPAFTGLNVAVERLYPTDPTVPPNPIQVAPVFALNYGEGAVPAIPSGLNAAVSHFQPTDPCMIASPIFHGLANALPPGDVVPT